MIEKSISDHIHSKRNQISKVPRHKVFVSFHSQDKTYKDAFVEMMEDDIVDWSVGDHDIEDSQSDDAIRQEIRDRFIREATVTVVLIGKCTWRRKHVDWEIGASLRHTPTNHRCGLLGILLPTHPNYEEDKFNERLVPPRLADNVSEENSFSSVIDWCEDPAELRNWIHEAFLRRKGTPPDNSYRPFRRNRQTKCTDGWHS